MIRLVEVLGYRCLRDIHPLALSDFQILVGPNASGKSTFLDAIRLLGDLLKVGLRPAIQARSPNFQDLVWRLKGQRFEILVELEIPEDRKRRLKNGYERARYEVALGLDGKGELSVLDETLWLKPAEEPALRQLEVFPSPRDARETILVSEGSRTPKG